ncbi:MAG: hypothetical protein GY832_14700 [Chloroflexi bacterium]|nr:hypothetical protein [Chloroflexota bacterium]
MESNIGKTFEIDPSIPGQQSKGKHQRRFTDSFAIIGPVLQQPRQFIREIRDGVHLPEKIWALSISSVVFLTIYGATLGSGYLLLSLNVAIAMPFLFLSSLITCLPVMYLLDVLTGSQRSITQIVAVLMTSLCAAATVFFSFAPIMVAFNLTGTIMQFFWLNVAILAMATLVGLVYMVQGIIQTAIVDTSHAFSKINPLLHFVWMLLFLTVTTQVGWWLLKFHQRTGGFLMILIQQFER